MKTLDEVIKAFEQCKDDKCYGCAYHEKVHANSCITKRNSDALIYLNAYQWQMTNPDGDHLQLEKCRALLSDFYRNDPLSWDELRTMEGNPVWATFDNENGTWYIAKVYDDEVILYEWGQEFGERISGKWDYTPKRWQAYRKERG